MSCYNCQQHCVHTLASDHIVVSDGGYSVHIIIHDAPEPIKNTRYLLELDQPTPVDGYNLPVEIIVGNCAPIPLRKYGYANPEYCCEIPKCQGCILLYYNGREFIDDRRCGEYWGY